MKGQVNRPLVRSMASSHIFKIMFVNQGKVYEVYARKVSQGRLFGFIEIEELVFGERTTVVLDPAEERIKSEFAGVKCTMLPDAFHPAHRRSEEAGREQDQRARGRRQRRAVPPGHVFARRQRAGLQKVATLRTRLMHGRRNDRYDARPTVRPRLGALRHSRLEAPPAATGGARRSRDEFAPSNDRAPRRPRSLRFPYRQAAPGPRETCIPGIGAISARFIHFVDVERDLDARERALLERLLTYGPREPGGAARLVGAELIVVPRFGTISPWSSKATDIARVCGLERRAPHRARHRLDRRASSPVTRPHCARSRRRCSIA